MSFDLKIRDGDLVIGQNNDLDIVENTAKLIQDILKMIMTPLGSNPYFPWYGSPITRSLLGRALDQDFVANVATQQLRSSLERLASLQQSQFRRDQLVTASEQLAAIQHILVERNAVDPRFYTIFLTVLTKAFSRVDIPIEVTI